MKYTYRTGLMKCLFGAALMAGCASCADYPDAPFPAVSDGKKVQVELSFGFADEEDGYGLGETTRSSGTAAEVQNGAFSVTSTPKLQTRAGETTAEITRPDALYELHVIQYTQGGGLIGSINYTAGATAIGQKLSFTLKQADDCQLVVFARGKGNSAPGVSGGLSGFQGLTISSDIFKNIPTSGATQEEMNKMPYILHLPHVNVTDDGKLQSLTGSHDARLLLKRLAAKLTVNWNLSSALGTDGYVLKEVKLCQVPVDFRILPLTEETEWGTTYPSAVSEFSDTYRVTDAAGLVAGTKTVWIPANVRGSSAKATSPYYRTKENAPTAASYVELVVDNSVKQERLYYRAYLGGKETTDFNLRENTDYDWTLTVNSANYRGDGRIQLLDQTPVVSTNLVPTSNCLMMIPGTNICFNPYKHEAGANGWNTYLTDGTSLATDKTIASVKVLWQTKDAGTSGDLVMGYVIDNGHHENLVNVSDIGDKEKALIHVKVPITEGGNAVIEAKNSDGLTVWSWHIWISNYVAAGLEANKITDDASRQIAISNAQNATLNGTVQVYQGISWTKPDGAFYKCVIMDRNLGAVKAGIQDNQIDGRRTLGLLYQGGRKDPFFAAADGTTKETKTIYDGYGEPLDVAKRKLSTVDQLIQNPLTFSTGTNNEYPASSYNWNGDGPKTIYDPCPKGWRVPSNGTTQSTLWEYIPSILSDDGTFKYCMWVGFGANDGTTGSLESTMPRFNNIMYYDGTDILSIASNPIKQSDFVGSGFVYYGTSIGPDGDKSIFFPAVSLREMSGNYRDKKNNTVYQWTSQHGTKTTSGMLIYQIQDNQISVTHPIDWKFGFSVRCVQDNIQKKP